MKANCEQTRMELTASKPEMFCFTIYSLLRGLNHCYFIQKDTKCHRRKKGLPGYPFQWLPTETCSVLDLECQVKFLRTTCRRLGSFVFIIVFRITIRFGELGVRSTKRQQSLSSCPISELSLSEAYDLANYSMQNIFKSTNFIIENRKYMDRERNRVCEQSPSNASGDENKANAFIILIQEQRYRDFSRVYSSLHWKFHKWKSFPQNTVYFTSCFATRVHCRPVKYLHNAPFRSFMRHMRMAHDLPNPWCWLLLLT